MQKNNYFKSHLAVLIISLFMGMNVLHSGDNTSLSLNKKFNTVEKQSLNGYKQVLKPNHIWNTVEYSGFTGQVNYVRYRVTLDTVMINGLSYLPVQISLYKDLDNWENTKKYVREADGKLWVLDSLQAKADVLIMDLNLEEGGEFQYIDILGETNIFSVTQIYTIIDFNGEMRKVIHLNCGQAFDFKWIEGIGPDYGVFESVFSQCVIDGSSNYLTCFFEDDQQLYYNSEFDDCWSASLISILDQSLTHYVVTREIFNPGFKMERWKFSILPVTKQGKSYFELLTSDKKDGNNYTGSGRFFREEDNRFYQFISDVEGERLLYDMNLNIGDSISIKYADGLKDMVVLNVDTIKLLDQVERKRITLQCVRDGMLEEGSEAEWIEGIGRFFEPFTEYSHCSIWDVARPTILCTYDGSDLIYKDEKAPVDCWVQLEISDFDQSTTWYSSSYTGSFSNGDCELKIDKIHVVKSMILGDKACHIVGVTTGGVYLPESEIAIYTKDNKMYFYEDDEWRLLYDFNANVGDTVTYYISKKYNYYDIFHIPGYYDENVISENPYKLIIKKIDTIYTQLGVPLKRFSTENVIASTPNRMETIIQHVGSTWKLFGLNYNFTPPECLNNFPSIRCYEDDNVSIQFVEGKCDMLSASYDIALNQINLHPNPGNDILNLSLSDEILLPIKYNLKDIAGRAILTGNGQNSKINIETNRLPSGLYFITIQDKENKTWNGKWVKN